MKLRSRTLAVLLLLLGLPAACGVESPYAEGSDSDQRFRQQMEDPARAVAQLVLLGDSLFAYFPDKAASTYERLASYRPLVFAVPGDTTGLVRARVRSGVLRGMRPEGVAVLAGTNDHGSSSEGVAQELVDLTSELHEHVPEARILLLGLLPRDAAQSALRVKGERINAILSAHAFPPYVTFVDVSAQFLRPDAELEPAMFEADALHITAEGYRPLGAALSSWLEAKEP